MARADLRLNVTVDTSELTEALDAVLSGHATPIMRRTLQVLRDNHRTAAPQFAYLSWPKNFDPEASRSKVNRSKRASVIRMAEGRLAAAAKAGYAHVSFEYETPVFEISARGRAALSGRS